MSTQETPTVTLATETKTVKSKPFIPQSPVIFFGGNPAKGITSREKALLLKVFNKTRTGEKVYTVEILYEKQTDAAPRVEGPDYQAPTGISPKVHMGQVIKASFPRRETGS